MASIAWNDPAVQSAVIGGLFTFISAVVAAIAAALIGKQIAGRKKLSEDLAIAIADIGFLLAVEEEHCKLHRLTSGESNKIRVRNEAINQGKSWSGRFTPGRLRRRSAIAQARVIAGDAS